MPKDNLLITAILCSQFALLPSVVTAQSSISSDAGSEHPFATIQASLIRAADISLSESAATEPVINVRDLQKDNFEEKPAPLTSLPFANPRIDSLQPLIQPILAREGLPRELTAVILIESSGNPMALSPKGARGLWQLMPETARRYGLRVDSHTDERTDIVKSTIGAAKYLHDLYGQFGSWPMALAAYNVGELNLQRAMAKARSNEFATLSALGALPTETRDYVPAVLAAMGNPSLPAARRIAPLPLTRVYAFSGQ
jgi:Predicted soluble lytic transglycosylase fused to an ABC-type amino acid-binding protein